MLYYTAHAFCGVSGSIHFSNVHITLTKAIPSFSTENMIGMSGPHVLITLYHQSDKMVSANVFRVDINTGTQAKT